MCLFFGRALNRFVCAMLALLLAACDSSDSPLPSTEPADARVDNAQLAPSELVVYSSRAEHLIQPVFDLYTKESGVTINFVTDKAGVLIERLKAEGAQSPADVFITVDAGTLGFAAANDLFQPLSSQFVASTVPTYLRDKNDLWTGLSLRARTIVYSTERVSKDQLSTYAALAESEWEGKLCLRTSKKVYNQSLVAMLISEKGQERTESIVKGWVGNLALDPTSNDTKLMQAIMAGQCDVGLVNSYYFGRLQKEQADLPLALFWPNQNDANSGVHVNVSGAGILKSSNNATLARDFINWLVSDTAQQIFAGVNQEYPVNAATAVDAQVASWGQFTQSAQPLSDAYKLQPAAVKLMDRVGYK